MKCVAVCVLVGVRWQFVAGGVVIVVVVADSREKIKLLSVYIIHSCLLSLLILLTDLHGLLPLQPVCHHVSFSLRERETD